MIQLEPGEYEAALNDVQIHYTIRGTGPVLIAHSGGPRMDARFWDDFAGIDDFLTIVVIHPRGSGISGPAAGDAYLLPDYAADVEALRLHLGLQKLVLMGWSHGGMGAQLFAVAYPDSLSRLILFDTSAFLGEFLGDIEAAVREFKDEQARVVQQPSQHGDGAKLDVGKLPCSLWHRAQDQGKWGKMSEKRTSVRRPVHCAHHDRGCISHPVSF